MIAVGFLAFYAKRAIFDRLDVLAGDNQPLSGVQVAYSMPGSFTSPTVYGGRIHLNREADTAEVRQPVWLETDTVSLFVRVLLGGGDQRAADAEVERIADLIDGEFSANPTLSGLTVVGVTAGDADYIPTPNPEPTVTSILRLQLTVEGHTT